MMTFIWICLILVILSMVGMLYRIFRGPSIPDRLIASDAIGVMLISVTALLSDLIRYRFFHGSHFANRNYVLHRNGFLLQIHRERGDYRT